MRSYTSQPFVGKSKNGFAIYRKYFHEYPEDYETDEKLIQISRDFPTQYTAEQTLKHGQASLTDAQRKRLRQLIKHGTVFPASRQTHTWLESDLGIPFQHEKGPCRGGEGSSAYPMGSTAEATIRAKILLGLPLD